MATSLLTKRALIEKTNTTIVIFVSVAVFLVVFSAVATKTLVSQAKYQSRVLAEKRKADNQLKFDIEEVAKLQKSYQQFVSTEKNVIGGNSSGATPQDGNNAKIVLDALPSRYDFPALTTNIEAIVATQNKKLTSITGTDDEAAQSIIASIPNPAPIAMPFQVSILGNYEEIKNVIGAFERSIRPVEIKEMNISGNQDVLTLTMTAQSYYQPAKSLNFTKKVVK